MSDIKEMCSRLHYHSTILVRSDLNSTIQRKLLADDSFITSQRYNDMMKKLVELDQQLQAYKDKQNGS